MSGSNRYGRSSCNRMCCESRHRHSIFCIVPPHVLREIARHGNAAQRNAALDTLALDTTMRTQRMAAQLLATSAPRPVLTAAAPQVHRTIYTAREHPDRAGHPRPLGRSEALRATQRSTRLTTASAAPSISICRTISAIRSMITDCR